MVVNHGEAVVYSGGTTHRPLPTHDPSCTTSTVPRCTDCDRAISAHDARTDGLCRRCRNPEAPDPQAPPKDDVYPVYTDDELTERFTAPTETPPTSTPAPAVAPAVEPPAQAGTVPTAAVEANAGVEPQPIRAKIAAAKPGPGVLIALTGPITAPQVAALVADLLTALNQGTRTAAPARSRKGKPATAGAAPRKSRSKLTAHHDDILAAYAEGQSPYEIACRYSTSDIAVRNYLKSAGITLRTRREAQLLRHQRATTTSTGGA